MHAAKITLEHDRIAVRFPYHPVLVELIKQVDRRWKFSKEQVNGNSDPVWTFPAEQICLLGLCNLFGLDAVQLACDLGRKELAPPRPAPSQADLSLIADYEFLTKPYEHQRNGLAELAQHPSWLLAWDMRVGKTKVVCDRLRMTPALTALILAPKSVLPVWEKELRKHSGQACTVVTGTAAQKREALKYHERIIVTNYDTLLNCADDFPSVGAVVADEVQYLKNSTTQRSKAARRLALGAKYRWALSGTPAPNSPLDWFGVLSFLDPSGQLAGTKSKTAFEARYAIKRQLDSGPWIVAGYRDLEDLHQRVSSCCSRVRKEDCLNMPPKIFSPRYCNLEPDQRRIYNELRKDAVARLIAKRDDTTLTVRNILAESIRLLQVVGGFVPDDYGKVHSLGNAKLALLMEVIEELGDKPVVVWCQFRAELKAIAEALTEVGRSVTCLHGDMTSVERGESIAAFHAGKADTFVSMLQVGREGIDLACADTEIFYSRSYSLTDWLQAQARLEGPAQKQSVAVIPLIAQNTVDEKVDQALEHKKQMGEMLLSRQSIEDML